MERAPNTHAIHALDSFFYTSMGVYAFESQCEMLAELGYDGITVSAWGGTPSTDLSQLPAVRARHGLEVSALYTVLHEGRNDAVLRNIIEQVEGVPLIELAEQMSLNGRGAILDFIALMQVLLSGSALAALDRVGYTGSLGILGWDYCGDVYSKLQRCLSTLRGMDQRLQRQLARRVA